jgi:HAD superfamily hydrolase (TIGR01450 family)
MTTTMASRRDPALARALDGVRAFVLDADGVLMWRSQPIVGSAQALVELRRRRIPYRVVTNFSTAHRASLAAMFGTATGLEVDAREIITGASAAAAYTAAHHPGERLLVLAAPDALREWDGQRLVSPDEAAVGSAPVAAVVIGDAGDELTFRNLDIAYGQVHAGAEFVAIHRNLWWMTPKGHTLDSGALIVGLEAALGRRAIVTGKPSPVVFRQAVSELAAELAARGEGRLRRHEVAMVGDDPIADIAAARRVGLRGILVLTGKADAALAAVARATPDAVAASLGEVVSSLPT